MRKTRPNILALICLMVVSLTSQIVSQVSLALTIYNGQFAMVKDVRSINFDQNISLLYFTDVSSNIEAETVTFKPLNSTDIRVFEQNFERNLIDSYSLLERFLNKKVIVYAKLGSNINRLEGTLFSHLNGYILQAKDGIYFLKNVQRIKLSSLPEGFFTVPTLNWRVFSNSSITIDCEVAYRTTGLSWKSDYSLVLNQDEIKGDLTGWVSIDNRSGKRYENTKLKLIAGEVQTQTKTTRVQSNSTMALGAGNAAPSFTQKSFSDYHIYTLSQPTTLNDNSQKEIEFIPKVYDVPIRKYHLVSIKSGTANQLNLKVGNRLQFQNSLSNSLGIPFPKGTFRVFKDDESDGSLEFVGEDSIDHIPKDENVTLKTGFSFDIVANKVVSNIHQYPQGSYKADLNLTIVNHKALPVEIVVEMVTPSDNLKINWAIEGLNIEKVSSQLLRIKRVFEANQKYSFLWSENYNYQ